MIPARNGHDALMVVTGLDPSGFFVTDISACRRARSCWPTRRAAPCAPESPRSRAGSPTPTVAATRASMAARDAATSRSAPAPAARTAPATRPAPSPRCSSTTTTSPTTSTKATCSSRSRASVQEFTSTTQMVFPAWTTAERVRRLPQDQWNKWLQYAKPYDINARTCGQDNAAVPFLTDALCGHNRRNLKMESLESAPGAHAPGPLPQRSSRTATSTPTARCRSSARPSRSTRAGSGAPAASTRPSPRPIASSGPAT